MIINESKIIQIMNTNNQTHIEQAIRADINELKPKIEEYLDPKFEYSIHDDKVYVAVTLGQKITQLTTKLWQAEDYFKAMVLDTILTDLLFSLSNSTYQKIRTEILHMNKALSKRLTPGDELEMSENKTILDQLSTSLSCNDYYVIEPINSLVYMYLIQDEFDCNEDISCQLCPNQLCHLRSKYEHFN